MKSLKYIIVCVACCLSIIYVSAQQRMVSVQFITLFPGNADSSEVVTARVAFKNIDTAIINASYSYAYKVNGVQQIPSGAGLYPTGYNAVALAPGDSIIDTLTLRPGGASFSSGPSVVVIWPIRTSGDSIYAVDSLKFVLEVTQNPVGIGEIVEGALYYNNGRIMLREAGKNELMQVRIWNTIGAEMYYTEGVYAQYIELPDLPAGILIAEAILSNNKRAILKFVKPLH